MGKKAFYEQKDLFGNSEIVFLKGEKKKGNTLFEYDDFIDKFKNKKTTDDCYTPKAVFDIILNYLKENGKLKDGQKIVRPFFPDNDYEEVDYPKGCIVIDNPPFSIFSRIVRFYVKNEIPFFLFAPHLTLFGHKEKGANSIVVGADIIYENGAKVKTSFVSNLFGDVQAFSDYRLYKNLEEINEKGTSLPKYTYPDEVMTVSDFTYLLNRGIEFSVNKDECIYVSKIDAQRKYKKGIFGTGLLMIKAKAEAKAEAKAKAKAKSKYEDRIVFVLSEREKKILSKLGNSEK